eukprot:m.252880 g.252880  ORF g.252880 m.252880 type:complete len:72 (+) comp40358_c0_seq5:160-375(+)
MQRYHFALDNHLVVNVEIHQMFQILGVNLGVYKTSLDPASEYVKGVGQHADQCFITKHSWTTITAEERTLQ